MSQAVEFALNVLISLRKQWFLLGLAVVITFAWLLPGPGLPGHVLHAQWSAPAAIALSFLASGLTLPFADIAHSLGRVRVHGLIQGTSFVIAPLVVVLLSPILGWFCNDASVRHGFLVLACLPTTVASCAILTRSAGGNEALALCNASLGNLLGIIITPLLLSVIAGEHAQAPMGQVIATLMLEVALPLLIGQCARVLFTSLRSHSVMRVLKPLPNLCLLFIIYTVFCATAADPSFAHISGHLPLIILSALVVHLILVTWSWWLSGLGLFACDRADRIAIVFCASQKTLAVGIPMLALLHGGQPGGGQLALATVPVLIYHPLQLIIGGMMAARFHAHTQKASPTAI